MPPIVQLPKTCSLNASLALEARQVVDHAGVEDVLTIERRRAVVEPGVADIGSRLVTETTRRIADVLVRLEVGERV